VTDTLEAIPAVYRSARMRSRLEVRWAVWMDCLSIEWHYEHAPVQVHGRPRWPDFWLPAQEVWLEVKPAGTVPDEDLALGVAEVPGSPLIWLSGSPWPGDYSLSLFHFGGVGTGTGLRWALGRRDHSQLWVCDPGAVVAIPLPPREVLEEDDFPLFDCELLREAFRAASTWRFEEET
jgi:hypothetical protein